MSSLAIVIPAYKEKYLAETLRSFQEQTVKDFTIYVGDDCSPYNLKTICDQFDQVLDLKYHRFDNNIGSQKLVHQWTRCIDLTQDEAWIWLFSDDDLVQNNAVEYFYKEIAKAAKFDVYRFNTCVIDGDSKIKDYTPVGPKVESSEALAYNILLGKRGNCMPDHIFSRQIYQKTGGIVYTDYAQGADWATSIRFSGEKGLCIIDQAIVYWRYSGANISSTAYAVKNQTTIGHIQFLEWVLDHFKYLQQKSTDVSYKMLKDAVLKNFQTILFYHYRGFSTSLYGHLHQFLHHKLQLSAIKSAYILVKIKMELAIPNKLKRAFIKFSNVFK